MLSLGIWLLLFFHPDTPYLFNELLPSDMSEQRVSVSIVIPCRNEEQVLDTTLAAITNMDYENYEVIVVDDCSEDRSQSVAKKYLRKDQDKLVIGKDVPQGWVGKMWALQQGVEHATGEWLLLSDADILYPRNSLTQLLSVAKKNNHDLVSVMVSLTAKSFWEKLLVPAFVYFFKILYPFKAIRKSHRKVAAAAGGCVLIKKQVLKEIGGISSIQKELIDDVALAKQVKSSGFCISLWLSQRIKSVRGYQGLKSLWNMVARSAFTELKYSYFRLFMCTIGMILLFVFPVYAFFFGLFSSDSLLILASTATYLVMTCSYVFAIRFYQISLLFAFTMPFIGLLYMLMTIDSAIRYTMGTKASWKGRHY